MLRRLPQHLQLPGAAVLREARVQRLWHARGFPERASAVLHVQAPGLSIVEHRPVIIRFASSNRSVSSKLLYASILGEKADQMAHLIQNDIDEHPFVNVGNIRV